MQTESAARVGKTELSYMNIICSLLVIFIHCASVIIGGMTKADAAFNIVFVPWRLSTFVVPAFIFMSGVKFFLTDKKMDYPRFYRGRLTRVVIPYMIWVAIYMIYFVNHGYFDFSLERYFGYCLKGDLAAHFYFVVIIVQFYLLMPLWKSVLRKFSPAAMITAAILISVVFGYNLVYLLETLFPGYMFEYGDVIFTKYLFYWVLGCAVGMNYQSFKAGIMRRKMLITVIFIVVGALDLLLAYNTFSLPNMWMEETHMIYCSAAIIFLFMLCSLIAGDRHKVSWFTRALDSESYNIYLSHCLIVIWLGDYLITELKITDTVTRFGYITAATYIVPIAIFVLWWLVKLLFKQAKKFLKRRSVLRKARKAGL